MCIFILTLPPLSPLQKHLSGTFPAPQGTLPPPFRHHPLSAPLRLAPATLPPAPTLQTDHFQGGCPAPPRAPWRHPSDTLPSILITRHCPCHFVLALSLSLSHKSWHYACFRPTRERENERCRVLRILSTARRTPSYVKKGLCGTFCRTTSWTTLPHVETFRRFLSWCCYRCGAKS